MINFLYLEDRPLWRDSSDEDTPNGGNITDQNEDSPEGEYQS